MFGLCNDVRGVGASFKIIRMKREVRIIVIRNYDWGRRIICFGWSNVLISKQFFIKMGCIIITGRLGGGFSGVGGSFYSVFLINGDRSRGWWPGRSSWSIGS